MLTRYLDRRQFIRVPASGPARFRCGRRRGECELIDISPGGLGLRFAGRTAPRLGEKVDIMVDLGGGCEWRLPAKARVVRRQTNADGSCAVGVEFPSPAAPKNLGR